MIHELFGDTAVAEDAFRDHGETNSPVSILHCFHSSHGFFIQNIQ